MSELDPAVINVFDALVSERGGPASFNAFQAEVALAIAQSLIDVQSNSVGPIERGRIMESVGRMMGHMPLPPKQAANVLPRRNVRDMSLLDLAAEYEHTLKGDPTYELYRDDEPYISAPAAQPQPPMRAPPPDATATPPEPEAAIAAAQAAEPGDYTGDAPERTDADSDLGAPRRTWRPGALRISQELLDKVATRADARDPNALPFTDMRSLLRSQGYR